MLPAAADAEIRLSMSRPPPPCCCGACRAGRWLPQCDDSTGELVGDRQNPPLRREEQLPVTAGENGADCGVAETALCCDLSMLFGSVDGYICLQNATHLAVMICALNAALLHAISQGGRELGTALVHLTRF